MRDLRLTGNDLDVTAGDVSFVEGAEAIAQDVTMRLRTWLGETVYAPRVGVPYLQIVFRRGEPIEAIRLILEQQILAAPGVTGVTAVPSVDPINRRLSLSGTMATDAGSAPIELEISP